MFSPDSYLEAAFESIQTIIHDDVTHQDHLSKLFNVSSLNAANIEQNSLQDESNGILEHKILTLAHTLRAQAIS